LKTNRSVVRNQAYSKGGFSIRERHNERENVSYSNADIIRERAEYNVHYKKCDGSYEQEFNRMVDDGTISLRGLKSDAKVFDEFVFDVNSEYFEQNGGYEFAKKFYAEAYSLAVKEAGGEEYILSAVLHADERNKALSEQYGHDVFHYHLHVVYIPVVEKKVYFRKNNKDLNLAGKLKETINQVSHSKRWSRFKDENGRWVNSYSLLQDIFHEHMKEAGYTDIERGERGSTAEHLTVLEFKAKKESERLEALTEKTELKKQAVSTLDEKTKQKENHIEKLNKQIALKKKTAVAFSDIENIGKPALLGGYNVSADEIGTLKHWAKKGVVSGKQITDLKRERDKAVAELAEEKKKRPSISGQLKWIDKFMLAMKRAPKRLMAVIDEILHQPPETSVPEQEKQLEKVLTSTDKKRQGGVPR